MVRRAVARKTSTSTRSARPVRTRKGSDRLTWAPERRVAFLADAVGGPVALARMLEVSPSQPTRWRSGEESPGLVAAQRIIGLDAVVAQLLLLWDPGIVPDWLTSANGHLDGARPIDVLKLRGPAEVLEAVAAEASGAYA